MDRPGLTVYENFVGLDGRGSVAGKGSYGVVMIHSTPSGKVAVKEFTEEISSGLSYSIMRELAFYGYLTSIGGHRAFPKIHGIRWEKKWLSLVMDAAGDALSLRSIPTLDPVEKLSIAVQIIDATYFLHHSLGVFQRDIKSTNLIWNGEDAKLSVVDWGICRFIENHAGRELTPIVQTLPYRAPEILMGQTTYGPQADVWSLGIFLQELWSGELQTGTTEIEQLFLYFQQFGTPDETTWPGFSDLPHFSHDLPVWKAKPLEGLSERQANFLSHLLVLDPRRRWTMGQVRNAFYQEFEPLLEMAPVWSWDPVPSVYPSREDRDLVMGNEMPGLSWPSSYLAKRGDLWAWMSEMENRGGDPPSSAAHAMSLVDRYVCLGLTLKMDELRLAGLVATWIVSKLHSTIIDDLDACLTRAATMGLTKLKRKDVIRQEKRLVTTLGFALMDLSPQLFWRLIVHRQPLDLDTGYYLLDLWGCSPDFSKVAPQDAAYQVQEFLMRRPGGRITRGCKVEPDGRVTHGEEETKEGSEGVAPTKPVIQFLEQALTNPMAYKDISKTIRHRSKSVQDLNAKWQTWNK